MQDFTQKAVNTFIGGLITEAGELTFPPNASVDELNCVLERDGSRRRRLGVAFETDYELSGTPFTAGTFVSVSYWENVGGIPGLQYVVVQRGGTLYFYIQGLTPLSANQVNTSLSDSTPYTVSLSTFAKPTATNVGGQAIQTASINGDLVVCSPQINSFYITRNNTTEAFTETEIDFRVRDFSWQGDKSTYYESVSSPSTSRKYDTKNCGWVDTKGTAALATYQTANSNKYPPLNIPWYSGKDGSGNFDAAGFAQTEGGTSIIANGHYILDLYDKDRDTASGLSGVTTTTETSRFKTVATYAGRMFYSGMESGENASRIYFSQVDEETTSIGDCFQVNDPTNEYYSDLLDTDGGFINIPEAHNIQKLHVFGAKLFVFAENGIWSIGGVDDVFRATQYSVDKISEVGIAKPSSFVSANGRPYWWSSFGIHTLVIDQVGEVREQSLTISTIQTFFKNIDTTARDKAQGAYDGIDKKIYWVYPDNDATNEYAFTNVLVFDETLGAFYPWAVDGQYSHIVGAIDYENVGLGAITYTVVDSSDQVVVDSSANTVVQSREGQEFNNTNGLKFLVYNWSDGDLTFAEFSSTDFLDWGDTDYSSYAEAGYDFLGDLSIKKNVPYLTVFLKRTETGFESDGGDGYTAIRPSSCTVTTYWDFNENASSSQEAYRLKLPILVDADDLTNFQYPESVVATRLKTRGRGYVMNVKFSSVSGHDFHLLGWETIGARNKRF